MARTLKSQRAAFIAALTATDQLSANQRRMAEANRLRDEHKARKHAEYSAWMTAEAAYHRAQSLSLEACLARVANHDDADQRDAADRRGVQMLIEATDAYVRCPATSNGQRRERIANVRKWGRAARTKSLWSIWDSAAARWNAILEAEVR